MKIKTILLSTILMLSSYFLFAQVSIQKEVSLNWETETASFLSDSSLLFTFDDASYDLAKHSLPIFKTRIALNQKGPINALITRATYSSIDNTISQSDNELLANDIVIESNLTIVRGEAFARVGFIPLRINPISQKIEKLESFVIEIEQSTDLNTNNRELNYTDNSVLSQGSFYKFSVKEDGIYKINYQFLNDSLDININDIQCSNIRVYGNGGGMLPQNSSAERADDLVENPIEVFDQNNNNLFDEDDYILFYGQGPHAWSYDEFTKSFLHQFNKYSNENYYFLNFDLGTGKRISEAATIDNHNVSTSSYNYHAFHESQVKNLLFSGRNWVGEEFSATNDQSFSFSSPNRITTEPISINTALVGRIPSGATANAGFNIFINNEELKTVKFESVNFTSEEGSYAKSKIIDTLKSFSNNNEVNIRLTFSDGGNNNSVGWLDYIEVNTRNQLKLSNSQFTFRDQESVGSGNVVKYNIEGSNIRVWEVSDIGNIRQMNLSNSGNQNSFVNNAETLREYIAFNGSSYLSPNAVGLIESQNLHEVSYPDYLIITHPSFTAQANQLADFHRDYSGLEVKVANISHIYNEFSSGRKDISAIRNYAKMIYDRGLANNQEPLKYLLLIGDASYDFKGLKSNNSDLVPTFESLESFSGTGTYCTDDYYALLDDNEGDNMHNNQQGLDIGIGRFPITTVNEAQGIVNKIIHYKSYESQGDWINNFTFVADDPDKRSNGTFSNIHFKDAESHAVFIDDSLKTYNIDKIYLDAYEQESTSGGGRYPNVNEAISRKIFSGTAIMNYTGHGGPNSWTQERILDIPTIQSWNNIDKLPLFITATCSFSKYDDPDQISGGEHLLLNPNGGCIAIVTTVRLVYANENRKINRSYLSAQFTRNEQGQIPTFGEALMNGKNKTESGVLNNRKFVLLGDPALRLNYPQHKIRTTHVNGQSIENADTIKALSKVTIRGQIEDTNGVILEDFNGIVYPTLFEKRSDGITLGNDLSFDATPSHINSVIDTFKLQKNAIFKGKASVENGQFEFNFIVPKDIVLEYGNGRLNYYAHTPDLIDAHGYNEEIKVGGLSNSFDDDQDGPEVEVFLNDDNFVFGGLTNESPLLIVKLFDENGINTVGSGIGHDITGVLNDDNQNSFSLNEYYNAELNSYQKGQVEFPMSQLPPGQHTLTIKAWDVYNNSGKGYTEFVVAESAELALDHVLNYPNPFTDQTSFWFEHNRPGDLLKIKVRIFTISGQVIKTIEKELATDGTRVDDIHWDGLDDFGNRIGRGTYVYQLNVEGSDGNKVQAIEKLVILK